jgi:hypothetical protein
MGMAGGRRAGQPSSLQMCALCTCGCSSHNGGQGLGSAGRCLWPGPCSWPSLAWPSHVIRQALLLQGVPANCARVVVRGLGGSGAPAQSRGRPPGAPP